MWGACLENNKAPHCMQLELCIFVAYWSCVFSLVVFSCILLCFVVFCCVVLQGVCGWLCWHQSGCGGGRDFHGGCILNGSQPGWLAPWM